MPEDTLTTENTTTGLTNQVQPAPEQVVTPPQQPETGSPTVVSTDSLRAQLDEGKQRLQRLQAELNQQPQQVETKEFAQESKTIPDAGPQPVDPFAAYNKETERKTRDIKKPIQQIPYPVRQPT